MLSFFEVWGFVVVLSSLVEIREPKIFVYNFQPSLFQKILSSFGNRMLQWEVSGILNNSVTRLAFNKKSLSFEISDLLSCKNQVSHNAFNFLLL